MPETLPHFEGLQKLELAVCFSGRRHNKPLRSDYSKKEATTGAPNATTAVVTMITQGRLPVERIKLVKGNHSLSVLDMCDTGC